ncbi:MAG: hypothetical protein H7X88_11065, partial [Gloeobacteraceae cyanobacterium ES-bin-316]|nr:hypothetical protein [Ferruginibacter sp.]
ASKGLKEITIKKNYAFTPKDLCYVIITYQSYLESRRKSSQKIPRYKNKIYTAFQQLKTLYPAATFPDFCFVIGVFGSGGTGLPSGMFIGAEIEAADKNSPLVSLPTYLQTGVKTVDKIHLICSHELIHFQQTDQPLDLLGAAIHEGACDFIGQLISGGLINQYQHDYGNAREKEIWQSFKGPIHSTDYSKWLYNGGSVKDGPADMGYYVGYKICAAYYARARDKKKALREILTIKNYDSFLEKSGYDATLTNGGTNISTERYDMQVKMDPAAKTISVKAAITLTADGLLPDTLKLLLHKDTKINRLTLNNKAYRYELESSDKPANRYMPESRNLIIITNGQIRGLIKMQIEYETSLQNLKQNNSSFTNEWISLASYSSWYPVNYDWGNFAYKIVVSIPADFKMSGTGEVLQKSGKWEFTSPRKMFDMVLVASNILKSKEFVDKGARIKLDYIDYQANKADSIIDGTAKAYNFFKSVFGAVDSAALTIVATPRKGNSAFSRKNFIYLQTQDQDAFATDKTISHETAHFWWNKASSEDWNDWLNEGFAEMSSLLFIKETLGEIVYLTEINKYRNESRDLPPIWEMDRTNGNASMMLYRKVPVILHDFMGEIGETIFRKLLKNIHTDKITSTDKLINLVRTSISDKAAEQLLIALKK